MGRRVAGRIRVVGWLDAVTPLSVGGLGRDADVDLVLARDGLGRMYVPGTSLAGPLRAWAESRAVDPRRWGFVDADDLNGGQASRVVVDDGLVVGGRVEGWDDDDPLAAADTQVPVEQRDGVGLDRITGAAATTILYRRDVLARGARIRFRLSVEAATPGDVESDRAVIASIVAALAAGRIRFGAGKTRGLGRVKLDLASCAFFVERLDSADAMIAALRGSDPLNWEDFRGERTGADPGSTKADVVVNWKPLGAIMVKTGLAGVVADAMPLLSAAGDEVLVQVLPGSSVKGALRSRAELIVRTVLGRPAPAPKDPRRRFLDQLAQFDLIDALFGRARTKADGEAVAGGGSGPEARCIGAVAVDDCYSMSEPIPRADWVGIVTGADESALVALAGKHGLRRADHVAIDRWTGGAADHLLFNALEPKPGPWEPLRIELDVDAIDNRLRAPALALLLLVLRDLKLGFIPLGFATNRGMGSIEVSGLSHPWDDVDKVAALQAAWQAWIDGERRR